jgi:hypothetical protein
MNYRRNLSVILIAFTLNSVFADPPTTAPSAPQISGKLGKPIQLFNGKDLDGWFWFAKPSQDATAAPAEMGDVWSVHDGILHDAGKPTGYLRTTKDLPANFILVVEQRHPNKGNGGVLIGITGEDKVWPRCVEVQGQSGQVGDFFNQGQLKMTVDPKREDPKKPGRHFLKIADSSEKPLGEWDTIEITAENGKLWVKVNGVFQNLATDTEALSGKIGLQAEGGEMEFRKMEVTPIEK